jgi:putative acetyltransferase
MDENGRIVPYELKFKNELLKLWEESVLETHTFLNEIHFNTIKAFLNNFDFTSITTYCFFIDNKMIGFFGVNSSKLEMLFIHPNFLGKGYGKHLLNFAIHSLSVNEVDVNEANIQAVKFYEKFDFAVYNRTEKDSLGLPYPILQLRLQV